MPNYSGHAPGHVREAFQGAVDAFMQWRLGEPEPSVEFELNYTPRKISISAACGLVWNCADQLPRYYVEELKGAGLSVSGTYASAARAMLAAIKKPLA